MVGWTGNRNHLAGTPDQLDLAEEGTPFEFLERGPLPFSGVSMELVLNIRDEHD